MNDVFFGCTACRVMVDAGYRWATSTLEEAGIVERDQPISGGTVLAAPLYWRPEEPGSAWLFVRIGIAIHDAGKILHPGELDAPGAEHEPAGQELLLKNDVSPELARVCVSHARWTSIDVTLEELLVALADKLWKGVRNEMLEQRVIEAIAVTLGSDRWDLFVVLDIAFEEIAAGGTERLERSRT